MRRTRATARSSFARARDTKSDAGFAFSVTEGSLSLQRGEFSLESRGVVQAVARERLPVGVACGRRLSLSRKGIAQHHPTRSPLGELLRRLDPERAGARITP